MIEIIDRTRGKKRVNVWFPDDGYITSTKCDVCCYVGISQLHNPKNRHVKFLSLVSDLSLSEDELFDSFVKVNRYDIRRSERDDITVIHYSSDNLNEDLLESYKSVYENMYYAKNLSVKAPIDFMLMYAKNGAMLVSQALLNETPIVYHVYIIDGLHARLWMSCSSFRDSEDKQYRALMGRANKRLHFEDMLYFKRQGYTTYDWGGISSSEAPNGIDKFKMSFGGRLISYYDETVLMSWKYKLFYILKEITKR